MARSVGPSTRRSRSFFGRGAAPAASLFLLPILWACSPEPTSQARHPASPASSTESGGGNSEPVIRAGEIFPTAVSRDSTVRVELQGEDPEGRNLNYKYQWVVNDFPIRGGNNPQFSLRQLKKGDRVQVEVIPSAGRIEGRIFKTSAVTLGNSAPEITEIRVEPTPLHRGEILKVQVFAYDPDGDQVALSYKWLRNGKEVPGATTDILDTTAFRKKDVLLVAVTASDGNASREPMAGVPMTIVNASPRITSTPSTAVNDGQYVYQVTATDPDEDAISYELKNAPPGMTIDTMTGKLIWTLTQASTGRHRVVIIAKDKENALIEQSFELEGQTAVSQPVSQPVPE
jgi:hypothetical protein